MRLGVATFLLCFAWPAHAYLDPGTGSYVLQVAAASLFAAIVTLKTYWAHVKIWFSDRFPRTPPPAPPAPPEAPK